MTPGFHFAIDSQSHLQEMGYFQYPSMSFLAWEAQWFEYYRELQQELVQLKGISGLTSISIFNQVREGGECSRKVHLCLKTSDMDANTHTYILSNTTITAAWIDDDGWPHLFERFNPGIFHSQCKECFFGFATSVPWTKR